MAETVREEARTAPAAAGRVFGVFWIMTIVGGVLLAAAGLVLWARQGDALFVNYLVGALAGCL